MNPWKKEKERIKPKDEKAQAMFDQIYISCVAHMCHMENPGSITIDGIASKAYKQAEAAIKHYDKKKEEISN